MGILRVGLCTGPRAVTTPLVAQRLLGADILVFPEMVDSGYAALKAGASPHRLGDDLLSGFASASHTLAPYCIAGSVYLRQPPPLTSNTSLVYCRGRLIHRYDKIHLFRPSGDHRYFRPGSHIGTFRVTLPGARITCGVIICYDLRFPELVRAMARRGLEVLFVPARWPAVRDDAWRTLLKALTCVAQPAPKMTGKARTTSRPSKRVIESPSGTRCMSMWGIIRAMIGAVQAQDYPAAVWALGQRTRDATAADVHRLFDAGTIVRTHVLRPTLHFALAADVRWLLALTAPRLRTASAPPTKPGTDPEPARSGEPEALPPPPGAAPLDRIVPAKNWRSAWHGGARKIVREEHRV